MKTSLEGNNWVQAKPSRTLRLGGARPGRKHESKAMLSRNYLQQINHENEKSLKGNAAPDPANAGCSQFFYKDSFGVGEGNAQS